MAMKAKMFFILSGVVMGILLWGRIVYLHRMFFVKSEHFFNVIVIVIVVFIVRSACKPLRISFQMTSNSELRFAKAIRIAYDRTHRN